MNRYFYIHTLNGKPAYFSKVEKQIYYHSCFRNNIHPASSLKQIKEEQILAKRHDVIYVERSSRVTIIYNYVKYLRV